MRWFFAFVFCVTFSLGLSSEVDARQPTVSILSQNAEIVAAQQGGTINLWRRKGAQNEYSHLARLKNSTPFRGAVTERALVGVAKDGVVVWSGSKFEKKLRLPTPKTLSIAKLLISSDGRRAAMLYPFDGGVGDADAVRVWDTRRGTVLKDWRLKVDRSRRTRLLGGSFSTNGKSLALFSDEPRAKNVQVFVFDTSNWKMRFNWQSDKYRTAFALALSAQGKKLALAADNDILLWQLQPGKLQSVLSCDRIKKLFPKALQGPAIGFRGAHQLSFSPKADKLLSLHLFAVVGGAIWELGKSPRPTAWLKRPANGSILRQSAWQADNSVWLVGSAYSADVFLYRAQDERFILQTKFKTSD
jgi:hypothetical protein